jgi:hypothetical protein
MKVKMLAVALMLGLSADAGNAQTNEEINSVNRTRSLRRLGTSSVGNLCTRRACITLRP